MNTDSLQTLRTEIAQREIALQTETDPDIREAMQAKLNKLRAQAAALGATIVGDVVGGNSASRDYIESQNNYFGDSKPGTDETSLRNAYLSGLVAKANRVRIIGSDDWAERVKLVHIYTALMTDRSEKPMRPERLEATDAGDDERMLAHLSAVAVLNRERHLVLLGGPGSGKSTFAHFVSLCLAGQLLGLPDVNLSTLTKPLPETEGQRKKKEDDAPKSQPWDHGALLPVFVELRDFAAQLPAPDATLPTDALWQFIAANIGPADYAPHLRNALLSGRGLILLDGLDEVPDANRRRAQVKQAVQDFADTHRQCRLLVTSRTYAYQEQDWRLDDFAEAGIRPFTPEQITCFVDAWYAHMASPAVARLSKDDAEGKAIQLKRRLERDTRLAELAERPLLLTLISRLHMSKGGDLPSEREPIYDESVRMLLNDWEQQKVRKKRDGSYEVEQPSLTEYLKLNNTDALRKALQRLAYEAHANQAELKGLANIAQKDLFEALWKLAQGKTAASLNPVLLEDYLRDRAGILIAHANGLYQFPHRTFQEYLAARHLIEDLPFPDKLSDLVKHDTNRWREAVQLAAARFADPAPSMFWLLMEELCKHDPPQQGDGNDLDCWGALMAGQALLETGLGRQTTIAERDQPKRERVRLWMRHMVERGLLPPLDRLVAGDALAMLGDDRKGVNVVNGLPDIAWITIPDDGPFVYGEGKTQRSLSLAPFAIAKYPITFVQFQTFIDAPDGWRNPQWWQGLAADKDHRSKPGNQAFAILNRPRERVSWYDAIAFCRWLSAKLTLSITLPTEHQFEKAARGSKGNVYPWGPDYVEGYANLDETEDKAGNNYLQQTSAVGMYPQGVSPHKVLDMSGNVWEWCLNKYEKPSDTDLAGKDGRVVRGGSWLYGRRLARCAARLRVVANDSRNYFVGVRIVVSPVSS